MPMRLVIVFAAALFAATTLSACGQKGPLYLPSDAGGQAASR
ncbi:MAG TPA: lipoprotein [Gammaproteobacteria bacterium]|nr:lipoprotein [Gammaproteobacteria bacterium]